ncbi:MAG TPA: inorganic phosphate transporter [Opitutaceae bacterium]|jgi:PiT family inorganic phosphate transporter|nr:inorganic phosphate transporter [Opitutaceae bacterium]
MQLWGEFITIGSATFLFVALALALSFEFVNGFHDTANAVATVIYTNTLRPYVAVVWSGIWNLIGVLTSTGAVAYGIIALLPVELVINIGSSAGFAMVFALLLSAIIWNLGTWYLGLPASSSHTLIGSIMGVGLANSLMTKGQAFGEGVNWGQAKNIGLSLVVSPLVGFSCAALLLLLLKVLVKRPELYAAPEKDKAPPFWIRGLLVLTCTGVSFAHGSNDGQKGMGLLMLILIGVVPGAFALRMDTDEVALRQITSQSQLVTTALVNAEAASAGTVDPVGEVSSFLKEGSKQKGVPYSALVELNQTISTKLSNIKSLRELSEADRRSMRTDVFLVGEGLGKILKSKKVSDPATTKLFADYKGYLDKLTKYIPAWVKVAVALALGLGTMIGWKRIVVTVGEKIGKTHLTYAQGASAEMVAMLTIGAADHYGLPVSTTHVLSSGVAGTMLANHSGLQTKTLRNLLLAWVLTLPVCIFLGATLFAGGLFIVLNFAH